MAYCKIYLFTYKRNRLLTRAVKSLIGQTFSDWVCEVHNDDPEDLFPMKYINSLQDGRFSVNNHIVNLGPTPSFNLAFASGEQKYTSILEDDNWWEPAFLEEMVKVMDANNSISISWSNMRIWQESPSGLWEDTHSTVWPIQGENILFSWPHPVHAMGALHSNGAMLFRAPKSEKYAIPDNCDFNIMESVRERTFTFPIYLVKQPLANFANTLETSRNQSNIIWTASQTMLLASIVLSNSNPQREFSALLNHYKLQKPSPLIVFFLANFLFIKKSALYTVFKLKDWYYISKWLVKNCHKFNSLKKQIISQNNIFEFLIEKTRERNLEAP